MSFLVSLDRNKYPATALDGFTATGQFGFDNARAMMWLAQLAYETDNDPKVENILGSWQLSKRLLVTNNPITGLPPQSACVVVAAGHGATFVTFAGSDPLKIEDWITDFNAVQSADSLHTGFDAAVGTVWSAIQTAIATPATPGQPVFFTGHSLGGALAVLAAMRAAAAFPTQPIIVYTFGSPRTGGSAFFNAYPLNGSTFRLIHGTESCQPFRRRSRVTIAMSVSPSNARPTAFSMATRPSRRPRPTSPTSSTVQFRPGLPISTHSCRFERFMVLGPSALDQLAGLLPRMVRDHVPANYFRALSVIV